MAAHEEGDVVLTLIDFISNTTQSEAYSLTSLQQLHNYLKRKFREPIKLEYSGRFKVEKVIELEKSAYSVVLVTEYNLLMLVFDDGMVNFLDLNSYKVVSSIDFGNDLSTVCLERTPSQLNVILGVSNNSLVKYDLKKIVENSFSISAALIWEKKTECAFLWGFDLWKDQIFVVDYNGSIHIHEKSNGDHIATILPAFRNLVDLKFLPNGDFIAGGNRFIGIFKKDENGQWAIHKEIRSHSGELEFSQCFSIFYEETSEKIYISDADGSVLVFTKDLELLSKHKVGELNNNYCIVINEKNGKMVVCSVNKKQLLVLD